MARYTLPEETHWEGVPYAGCAVTKPVGSDSYPATVTWVSAKTVLDERTGLQMPRHIKIQGCGFEGAPGWDNSYTEYQKYVYYADDDFPLEEVEYSFRKGRGYVRVGQRTPGSQPIYFGVRRAYMDPCF